MIDTSVLVAALRSGRGASRRILFAALDRQLTALISMPLLLEYEAVLTRREQLRATGFSSEEIGIILDSLFTASEAVNISFLWRPMLTDPADEMVLETAVNGMADALVTLNIRDFAGAARIFALPVLTPGMFWPKWESTQKTNGRVK